MSSDLGPEVRALLGNGAGNSRASHLSLGIDDDTSIVYGVRNMKLTFEIEIVAFSPSIGLALPNNNSE